MKRIQKYLSEIGHCSRREAEQLIRAGKITVNGKVAVAGDRVSGKERIRVKGRRVTGSHNFRKRFVLFYKPPGIDMFEQQGEKAQGEFSVLSFGKERLFPVGKLDREAEGIIVLTNDGDFSNAVMQPGRRYKEEYRLLTGADLSEECIARFAAGIERKGKLVQPLEVLREETRVLRFSLQGVRSKYVYAMAAMADIDVVSLCRTRIGNLGLGKLKAGQWRELTSVEVAAMREGKPVKTGRRRVVRSR